MSRPARLLEVEIDREDGVVNVRLGAADSTKLRLTRKGALTLSTMLERAAKARKDDDVLHAHLLLKDEP